MSHPGAPHCGPDAISEWRDVERLFEWLFEKNRASGAQDDAALLYRLLRIPCLERHLCGVHKLRLVTLRKAEQLLRTPGLRPDVRQLFEGHSAYCGYLLVKLDARVRVACLGLACALRAAANLPRELVTLIVSWLAALQVYEPTPQG